MLQSDSTQTIDHIHKCFRQKIFRVREGRRTGPPYFFIRGGAEATSRLTPLFKWNHVFFSMSLLPILRRIQRPTTQGHSSHARIITFKESTNLGLGLPTEDARSDDPRSDDPRLVGSCKFADEKTV